MARDWDYTLNNPVVKGLPEEADKFLARLASKGGDWWRSVSQVIAYSFGGATAVLKDGEESPAGYTLFQQLPEEIRREMWHVCFPYAVQAIRHRPDDGVVAEGLAFLLAYAVSEGWEAEAYTVHDAVSKDSSLWRALGGVRLPLGYLNIHYERFQEQPPALRKKMWDLFFPLMVWGAENHNIWSGLEAMGRYAVAELWPERFRKVFEKYKDRDKLVELADAIAYDIQTEESPLYRRILQHKPGEYAPLFGELWALAIIYFVKQGKSGLLEELRRKASPVLLEKPVEWWENIIKKSPWLAETIYPYQFWRAIEMYPDYRSAVSLLQNAGLPEEAVYWLLFTYHFMSLEGEPLPQDFYDFALGFEGFFYWLRNILPTHPEAVSLWRVLEPGATL